jgi:hypothetical protein
MTKACFSRRFYLGLLFSVLLCGQTTVAAKTFAELFDEAESKAGCSNVQQRCDHRCTTASIEDSLAKMAEARRKGGYAGKLFDADMCRSDCKRMENECGSRLGEEAEMKAKEAEMKAKEAEARANDAARKKKMSKREEKIRDSVVTGLGTPEISLSCIGIAFEKSANTSIYLWPSRNLCSEGNSSTGYPCVVEPNSYSWDVMFGYYLLNRTTGQASLEVGSKIVAEYVCTKAAAKF